MKKEGRCRELREGTRCGAMGTIYRQGVQSEAVRVHSVDHDKAAWSCFELIFSVPQLGWEEV